MSVHAQCDGSGRALELGDAAVQAHGPGRHRRGAMLYTTAVFAVLLTAALSAAIVAGTLSQRRIADALDRTHEAEWVVRSGLNWALRQIYKHPNWRMNLPLDSTGKWTAAPIQVGNATFEVWGSDPDGDLADDPLDPVEIVVEATLGSVRIKRKATLVPYNRSLVTYAAFGWKKPTEVKGNARVRGLIRGNTDLKSDGNLTVDRLSGGGFETVAGSKVDRPLRPYTRFVADPLAAPDVDIAWYASRGTKLNLPGSGTLLLEKASLTPSQCIYNGTSYPPDPEGIYVVDAGGRDVLISDCYLKATLVIENAEDVIVRGAFRAVGPPSGDPVLIADCKRANGLSVEVTAFFLSEHAAGVDFNGDGDQTDMFRTRIQGTVYCDERILLKSRVPFVCKGLLVGREFRIDGPVTVQENLSLLETPVRGFLGPGLRVSPGTWAVVP